MKTAQFWVGEEGDAYTARCRIDWQARMPFWKDIITLTGARSVYELGCNAGWNLSAIRRCYPDVQVSGGDINQESLLQAASAGLTIDYRRADLSFTAGVLIHVPPEHLENQMQAMIKNSYYWILAIEYESEEEEEIEYQGEMGLLWKRPYGDLYIDMGLELVKEGAAEGFDNCHYWLLRK